ncbi:type II secretion system protein GspJ [Salipiger abyssi]|uniref:Type II secretion system protein J n=1 Tax=Salipiger abyssi TaxID=1250539 RepID=A0A1P8UXB1_9RHOB|nr:type II secretion system protein GspJ [Salipiger abyssi]APZ54041.1 type II secretion system protein J (GspJ) [Salipiger abyssi]
MTRARRTRGLTLIELVIAMALFALVAVMGLQSLTGMMRLRDGLDARSRSSAELAMASGLLRADLSAALPRLFYPPGGGQPRAALQSDDLRLALSTGGQPYLARDLQTRRLTQRTVPQRVEWRLDRVQSTLYRASWNSLLPESASQRSPETAVIGGVQRLRIRSYWPQIGWIDGTVPPAGSLPPQRRAPADRDGGMASLEFYSGTLPLAVELTLAIDGIGDITLLEHL